MKLSATKALIAAAALVLLAGGALLWISRPDGLSDLGKSQSGPGSPAAEIDITPPQERPLAPKLVWRDGEGGAHDLTDLRGKAALINLWATWCGPCVSEMPELDALAGRLDGEHFVVMAVAIDQSTEQAGGFLTKAGLHHLSAFTGKARDFSLIGLPTTLLIDTAGRLAWRGLGRRNWTAPEVENILGGLMAETAP